MNMLSVYLFKNNTSMNELEKVITDLFNLKLVSNNPNCTVGVNSQDELLVNINKLRLDFISNSFCENDLIFLRKDVERMLEKKLIDCESFFIETYEQNSQNDIYCS